jgi:hypothetical protein
MSVEGLEPSTNGLKGHCSTIELHAHLAKSILSCDINVLPLLLLCDHSKSTLSSLTLTNRPLCDILAMRKNYTQSSCCN